VGAIHPRYTTWTLDLLAASPAIALVTPDSPDVRVEEHTMGGGGLASGPQLPSVKYALAFHRFIVEEWLTANGPERIEVVSASNEGAVRDAGDRLSGMFGHVHHVVQMHRLDEWLTKYSCTTGRRLVFLRPSSAGPFSEVAPGLSLSPELADRVRGRIGGR